MNREATSACCSAQEPRPETDPERAFRLAARTSASDWLRASRVIGSAVSLMPRTGLSVSCLIYGCHLSRCAGLVLRRLTIAFRTMPDYAARTAGLNR